MSANAARSWSGATAASTPHPGLSRWPLAERARAAFVELIAEHDTGPIALVSHDAFNRALLQQVDPPLTHIGQRTACWNQLSFVEGAWRVDAYDQKPGDPG